MLSLTRRRYLESASNTYADQLKRYARDSRLDGARSYLSNHGITYDMAVLYRLGFVMEPVRGDERFTGMLSIPYLSPAGVIAIKYRSLSEGGMKYAQPSGQEGRLYNTEAYFKAGTTIGISEGEVDAISATEHLGIPTLGAPGASAWKDQWTALTKDFTEVIVFADGDQPGRDFAYGLAERIGWRARVVRCTDGEDVSSMCADPNKRLDLVCLVSTSKVADA